MPVDASIYSQFAQPAKSVNDYKAQYDAADLRALGLSKNRLDLTNQQAIMAQRDALRADVQSGAIDLNNPQHRNALMSKYPDIAPSLLDQIDKGALTRSTVGMQDAHATNYRAGAAKDEQATAQAARVDELRQVASLQTPDEAKALLGQYVNSGHVPPQLAAGLERLIDTDPKWQVKLMLAAVDPKSAAEMLMPHLQTTDLGGSKVTQAVDKITGVPTQTGAFPVTQHPDNAATNATSRANNMATIAGENTRNAATIAKDLQIAGIGPGGKLDDNSERTAQAIASGQLPAPTGMALLNPRNQRILGRVMEVNPQYDFTDVSAKKAAATDFTSGKAGVAMQAFAVANQHLDQAGQLAEALKNGNVQIVNKIGNFLAQQTGSPAPTNFDAVKAIASKEAMKAIVAGGGGQAEREELSNLMSKAQSPQQIAGVIDQFRGLMQANYNALLMRRRAAGLRDETLPDYSNIAPHGPGASPAGGFTYVGKVGQ